MKLSDEICEAIQAAWPLIEHSVTGLLAPDAQKAVAGGLSKALIMLLNPKDFEILCGAIENPPRVVAEGKVRAKVRATIGGRQFVFLLGDWEEVS